MTISEVKGVIFDVDDTIFDNFPKGQGLHERSRLAAFREIGKKHNIPELINITEEQNYDAFHSAPIHSMPGAVWNYFWKCGLADSEVINLDDKLLQEVVAKKDELHFEVLMQYGKEVDGAEDFIAKLAGVLGDKMAVASSGILRDIKASLKKIGVEQYFGDRILSIESVTHTKPHPEIYEKAFLTLGMKDSDKPYVLAFEDDPRGITSAKAAGLFVCGITTRFTREQLMVNEFPPDMVADSFEEFAEILGLS